MGVLELVIALFGTGTVSTAAGILGGRRLAQAQAAKVDAEKVKAGAEGASVLVSTAISLAQEAKSTAGSALAAAESAKRMAEGFQRRAIAHLPWDLDMVHKLRKAGIDVNDPPPLFAPELPVV